MTIHVGKSRGLGEILLSPFFGKKVTKKTPSSYQVEGAHLAK